MTKFIELEGRIDYGNYDERKGKFFVNVENICYVQESPDEENVTYIQLDRGVVVCNLPYEEVKAKIKRSGVISCSEIVKR